MLEQKLVGMPSEGDVDVPTDVVLVYNRLYSGFHDNWLVPPELSLIADDGEAVPFTLAENYTSYMEYSPQALLRPNTGYTFRGTSPGTSAYPAYDLHVHFTTGSGRAPDLPPPPSTRYEDYVHVTMHNTSCSQPLNGGCVSLDAGTYFQVRTINSFGHDPFPPDLIRGSFFSDLQTQNLPCVELRQRAANGALGEAQVLCGDGAPLKTLTGDGKLECTPEGVVLMPFTRGGSGGAGPAGTGGSAGDPNQATPERLAKGCTCSTPPRAANRDALGVALALGLVLFARRRR